MGRFSIRARLGRHWRLLAAGGAALAMLVAACSSATPSGAPATATGGSGSSVSAPASSGQATTPATHAATPAPTGVTSTAGQTTTNVKISGEVAGTKAICAALTQNTQLPALVGTNPAKLLYASGTVTNDMLGLNNVPGCQVGIDPTATDVTIAWALCHMDPKQFTDAGPIGGTSDVYNFAGTANGVVIVLNSTSGIGLLTGTAGSRSQSVLVAAMKDAATIFTANGGCSSQ